MAKKLASKGKRLDPALLGKGSYTAQIICGCDVFAPIDMSLLIPEEPPSLTVKCLPGTNRRPVKAWQLCTAEEKTLEISLACSMDYILDIAIDAKQGVPDPEDVSVDTNLAPLR